MATTANFIETSGEAPFVLQCTVKKLNASNLNTVSPDNNTAILKIDTVFRAPNILGNLTGKLITVKLTRGGIKANQQFILMARPWQYSSNIAVVEIERTTSKVQRNDFQQQIINSHLKFIDGQLENRISTSILIISGRVLNVERLRSTDVFKLQDEGRGWYEATILVQSILKGKLRKTPEIKVRFRGIESERWYATPKFYEGQEGIWLLHENNKGSQRKVRGSESYLTAPDPLDFHLLNQLSRIASLIKRSK